MTNSLLIGVEFERVHFRFGLEASDFQFKLISIFFSLSLFPIRLVENFALSFSFIARLLYIVQLEKNVSVSALITDNKIRFSEVCSSGPIRLTGKFASVLFNFYPNLCILLVEPPLGGLLENPVDISFLLYSGFY